MFLRPPISTLFPYTTLFRSQLVGDGQLFMLKVVGDSMVDAAICDGDWVVVRQQPVAENGDIVAAMLEGEATDRKSTRLNSSHPSISYAVFCLKKKIHKHQ